MKTQYFSPFSKEDSAFISQQIEEFRPFMSEQGEVSVEEYKPKKSKVGLKITIQEGEDSIKIKTKGSSIAEAMMKGKSEILKIFHTITDSTISNAERHLEVTEVLKNTKIH